MKDVAIAHFIVNPIFAYFVMYPLFKWRGAVILDIESLPSVPTALFQILIFILCEDTFFYWAHRLLHHRLIYRHIHKQHHQFKSNIGVAAEYAHPIESLFGVFVPFALGPLIVRPHLLVLTFWMGLRVTEAVDAHSGFRFPFSPFQIIDHIQGGAERHEFHHSHNSGSYGSFTTFWDWVTGIFFHSFLFLFLFFSQFFFFSIF